MNTYLRITSQEQAQQITYEDGMTCRVSTDLIDDFHLGNVRKKRNPAKFAELRADIRQKGVIQAVTIRPSPWKPGRFELLCGYGRRDAVKLEGLADLPVQLKLVDSDRDCRAIMLSENFKREDLTLVGEALAAQEFVSLYNGDSEQAANHLGWPILKVKKRLLLTKCIPAVLEALDDNQIKLGHAEILSQFAEITQAGTLQKILTEKWTIEHLKHRANTRQRALSTAPFDTNAAGCEQCHHNSSQQASLFDNSVGVGKCSEIPCFKNHVDTWLGEQRKGLADKYSMILIATDKPERDRRTVSIVTVGEDQFNKGCLACESHIAVQEDAWGKEGQIYEHQCIDVDCYQQKARAHLQAMQATTAANQANPAQGESTTSHGSGNDQPAEKTKSTSARKPQASVTSKTPKAVIEDGRSFLRSVAADSLLNNTTFMRAVSLAGIASLAQYTPSISKTTNFGTKDIIASAMLLDDETLIQETAKAIEHFARSSTDAAGYGTNFTDVMLAAFVQTEGHKDKAVAAWEPTQKNLSSYRKSGLEAICHQSGFSRAYDQANGKGSFKKLTNGKVAPFISAILAQKFDWSGYCPDAYMKLLS